jgi:tetratricopeptide (TPR) repeat protein
MTRAGQLSPALQDVALLMEAGFVYRYGGRYREARELFQGVRALLPDNDIADLALAGVSFDEGKFEEAEAHCRRAMQLIPRNAAAHVQLAEVQLFQNDIAGANSSLKRALELGPGGPTASLAHALIQFASMIGGRS